MRGHTLEKSHTSAQSVIMHLHDQALLEFTSKYILQKNKCTKYDHSSADYSFMRKDITRAHNEVVIKSLDMVKI